MADNAFTRSQQKDNLLKHVESQQIEVNLDYSSLKAGDDHIRKIVESVELLNNSVKRDMFNGLEEQVSSLFKTIASSDIATPIKENLLKARDEVSKFVSESQDLMKELKTQMSKALRADDGSQTQIDALNNFKHVFEGLNLVMQETAQSVDKFKQATNSAGSAEAIKETQTLSEEYVKLAANMKEVMLNAPHASISSLGEGYKFLREEITKTADAVSAGANVIIDRTKATMNIDGGDIDTATTLMFKQLQAAVQGTGSVVSQHGDGLVKSLTEMGRIAKGESKNVDEFNKSIEAQANMLAKLSEAEKDFSPDKLKGLSEKQVGDKLVEMQTLYKNVYDQIGIIAKEMNSIDPSRTFSTQLMKDFANAAGDVANKMRDIEAVQRSMGYNDMPKEIQAPTDSQFNRMQGQLTGKTKTGTVIDAVKAVTSGTGQVLLAAAGLGNLTTAAGVGKAIAGGVLNADKNYGNLESSAVLSDLMFNPNGKWDESAMLGANGTMTRGYDIANRTHGLVGIHDFEKQRQEMMKNIGGHYAGNARGLEAAGSTVATESISKLSEMSVMFQKGYGVSGAEMNGAINTVYKELNMDLNQTEFAMGKIATQATTLGVPFDKHLKQVIQLTMQYKEYGLSIDNAMNATGNLMNQQHMNATDANRVAGSIGNGMASMDQGMATYMGMRYGGMSDPFEARMQFLNKWTPDGQIDKNWAGREAGYITKMGTEFQAMGGGSESARQSMLYDFFKSGLKMDDFSSSTLSQTNDPAVIEELLSKMDKNGSIAKVGADGDGSGNPYDSAMKGINDRLEQSADSLSGIVKLTNQLSIEAANMAKNLHDGIDALTKPFVNGIHAFGAAGNGDIKTLENLLSEIARNTAKEGVVDYLLGNSLGLAGGAVGLGSTAYNIYKNRKKGGGTGGGAGGSSAPSRMQTYGSSGGGKWGRLLKTLGIGAAVTTGAIMFGGSAHAATPDDEFGDEDYSGVESIRNFDAHRNPYTTSGGVNLSQLDHSILLEEKKKVQDKQDSLFAASLGYDVTNLAVDGVAAGTTALATRSTNVALGGTSSLMKAAGIARNLGKGMGYAGLAVDPAIAALGYYSIDKDLRTDVDARKAKWQGGLGVAGTVVGGTLGTLLDPFTFGMGTIGGAAAGNMTGNAIANSDWFGRLTGTSDADVKNAREGKINANQEKLYEEHQNKIKEINTSQLSKMVEMTEAAKAEGSNIEDFVNDKLPRNHQEAQALQEKIQTLTGQNESHLRIIADKLGLTFNQVLALIDKSGVTNTMYNKGEVDSMRLYMSQHGVKDEWSQDGVSSALKNKGLFKDGEEMNIFATYRAQARNKDMFKSEKDKDNWAMEYVSKYREDKAKVETMKKSGFIDKYKVDDSLFQPEAEGFASKAESILGQFASENNMSSDNLKSLITKQGTPWQNFAYGLSRDDSKSWAVDGKSSGLGDESQLNDWKELTQSLKDATRALQNNSQNIDTLSNTYQDGVLKIIGKQEGNFGSVNGNDNNDGASIGFMQWHNGRAKDLLTQIQQKDSELYKAKLGGSSLETPSALSSKFTIDDDSTKKALSDLLNTGVGKQVQMDKMRADVNSYLEHGKQLGIKDSSALAFFADLENQLGAGGAAKIARSSDGSLQSLYSQSLGIDDGKYDKRRASVYNSVKSGNFDSLDGFNLTDASTGLTYKGLGGTGLSGSSPTVKDAVNNKDAVRPLFSNIGSQSIYGMGDDASWSAKGMYSGLISSSDDGQWNNQIAARESGKAIFNININAEDPVQYEKMAKEIEEMAQQVYKKYKREQLLDS